MLIEYYDLIQLSFHLKIVSLKINKKNYKDCDYYFYNQIINSFKNELLIINYYILNIKNNDNIEKILIRILINMYNILQLNCSSDLKKVEQLINNNNNLWLSINQLNKVKND